MNNSPDNLEILGRKEHAAYHSAKRYKEDKFYSEKTMQAMAKGYKAFREKSNDRFRQSRNNNQKNHRINYVKKIDKRCTVWDIETDTSNFALSSGVFVHNSKDVSDAVAGVVMNIAEHTPQSSIGIKYANPEKMPLALRQHKELEDKKRAIKIQKRMLERQNKIAGRL